jgi:ABC-type nickel/cobalt efflux system permease component RcnA
VKRLLTLASLVVAALLLMPAPSAAAHPLGNFTVNRYSGITVTPNELRLTYVIDMAEIPTFQELPTIDENGDGTPSAAELDTWARSEAQSLAPGLDLTVDGRAVTLAPSEQSAALLPGQGGLQTLRFEGIFAAAVPGRGAIRYEDGNDDGRIGWREVTATGDGGVALSGSTVPSVSPSDELRSYPQDMLASPLHVTSMQASYAPGTAAAASTEEVPAAAAAGSSSRPATESAPLGGVLAAKGAPLVLLGLALAIVFGAWHALLPGHGKTLMAAAMVGGGARARQVVAVAAAVALMHSVSVLALGLAVLGLERSFRPETLYPWLGTVSGLAAIGVGLYLVHARWGAWRRNRDGDLVTASTRDDHDHGHEHVHADAAHAHGDHMHDDAAQHGHRHDLPVRDDGRLGARGLVALALAGGILPAPSALLAMLAAIQIHRVVYGLALVVAFSVGLAVALLGVGIGALRLRDALTRRVSSTTALAVPLASAMGILVVGAVLTVRALGAVV